MFCRYCGKQHEDSDAFCSGCGARLNENAPFPNSQSASQSNKSQRSNELIQQLCSRVKLNAILWIVCGSLQLLSGLLLSWPILIIVGVLNLVSGISDISFSNRAPQNPAEIFKRVRPLAGPILTLIYNLLFGGIIGIAGSIYFLAAVRGFVMEHRDFFESFVSTEEPKKEPSTPKPADEKNTSSDFGSPSFVGTKPIDFPQENTVFPQDAPQNNQEKVAPSIQADDKEPNEENAVKKTKKISRSTLIFTLLYFFLSLLLCSAVLLVLALSGVFHSHNLKKHVVQKATCVQDGTMELYCEECGYIETKKIDMTGHNMQTEKQLKEATCAENGLVFMRCLLCGFTEEKTISASHNFVNNECTECSAAYLDIEPDTWYNSGANSILKLQNALVTNAVNISSGRALLVTYYPICKECGQGDCIDMATVTYSEPISKTYFCDTCNITTHIRFKIIYD